MSDARKRRAVVTTAQQPGRARASRKARPTPEESLAADPGASPCELGGQNGPDGHGGQDETDTLSTSSMMSTPSTPSTPPEPGPVPTAPLPGEFYQRAGRWWWRGKLPGESKAKARPLKPQGAKAAAEHRQIAEKVAFEMWEHALQDDAARQIKLESTEKIERLKCSSWTRSAISPNWWKPPTPGLRWKQKQSEAEASWPSGSKPREPSAERRAERERGPTARSPSRPVNSRSRDDIARRKSAGRDGPAAGGGHTAEPRRPRPRAKAAATGNPRSRRPGQRSDTAPAKGVRRRNTARGNPNGCLRLLRSLRDRDRLSDAHRLGPIPLPPLPDRPVLRHRPVRRRFLALAQPQRTVTASSKRLWARRRQGRYACMTKKAGPHVVTLPDAMTFFSTPTQEGVDRLAFTSLRRHLRRLCAAAAFGRPIRRLPRPTRPDYRGKPHRSAHGRSNCQSLFPCAAADPQWPLRIGTEHSGVLRDQTPIEIEHLLVAGKGGGDVGPLIQLGRGAGRVVPAGPGADPELPRVARLHIQDIPFLRRRRPAT